MAIDSGASPLPLSTPIDIRRGMTKSADVAFPLRWGIIGSGSVSVQWVLSLRACEGATVTAVAARSADRAEKFAAKYDIPSAYGSYAEMVASPDVDIVYVGTITRLHKELSLLAIEAGKHVLCEKPLEENAADARAMYTAAADKNVMLQDGMWTRFFPAVEHARAAIEAGTIGDVVMVQSDFFDPIYTIQAAPLAFGAKAAPTAVTAAGRKSSGAVVAYGDDKCAVLTFSPFTSELAEVTEIIGSKGRITLGQPGHCPTSITIRIPKSAPSRYMSANTPAPEQRFDYPIPGSVSLPNWSFPNQHGFLYQAEAIHRCLAAGLLECPQYYEEESLHVMDLATEIYQARQATARSGGAA
jgi:dihydrodiol dehydrogenase / D-xylose 1-dehydrogenase (NADP)